MKHAAGPLHQPPGVGLHGGGHGGPDLAAGRAAAPPALRGGVPASRGRGGAEVRLPEFGQSVSYIPTRDREILGPSHC